MAVIPDPFFLEYAKSDRGVCKKCDRHIQGNGTKFVRRVKSRWHDGFDKLGYHMSCGKVYLENVEQLRGISYLRHKDAKSILSQFKVDIEDVCKQLPEYVKYNRMFWEVRDQLDDIPLPLLTQQLTHNGIENLHVMSQEKQLDALSDAIVCGLLPECPICGSLSLCRQGLLIRCGGFVDVNTKCCHDFAIGNITGKEIGMIEGTKSKKFETDFPRKGPFVPTVEFRCSKFWSDLKIPPDCPSLDLKMEQPSRKKREQYDSSSEEEECVPTGKELCGMKFTSVGKTNMKQAEIKQLVEKHSGTYSSSVDFYTILLVNEEDQKVKDSKKFQDAKNLGATILKESYLTDLLDRKSVKLELKKEVMVKKEVEVKKEKVIKNNKSIKKENSQSVSKPAKGLRLKQRKLMKAYQIGKGALYYKPPMVRKEKVSKEKTKTEEICVKAEPLDEDGQATEENLNNKNLNQQRKGKQGIFALDEVFGKGKYKHVMIDPSGMPYVANLNQCDIRTGVNKYYKLQCVEEKRPKRKFSLLRMWGRIGEGGDYLFQEFSSEKEVIDEFEHHFTRFTSLEWKNRLSSPVPGKMRFVKLEIQDKAKSEPQVLPLHEEKKFEKPSSLPLPLQSLMRIISDRSHAVNELEAQSLNIHRMPLGQLAKTALTEGYGFLRRIQDLLKEKENMKTDEKWNAQLKAACNQFYVVVPHHFPLNAVPPLIDNLGKLGKIVHNLESLLQIQQSNSILNDLMKTLKPEDSIFDQLYQSLNIKFATADPKDRTLIIEAVSKTIGPTHTLLPFTVVDVFEGQEPTQIKSTKGSTARKAKTKAKNRKLLWHGSQNFNWLGIIQNGLKIAPKDAPSSGYMFGKGLYFADVPSKSAQYVRPSDTAKDGVIAIFSVDIVEPWVLKDPDEKAHTKITKLKKDHVFGAGKCRPQEAISLSRGDIPCGPFETIEDDSLSLQYNEYVVYEECSVKIEYLVHVVFDI